MVRFQGPLAAGKVSKMNQGPPSNCHPGEVYWREKLSGWLRLVDNMRFLMKSTLFTL